MSSFIVINPVITCDNSDELFSDVINEPLFPLMESAEHAALYKVFKTIPIRLMLMNLEAKEGFSDGSAHTIERGNLQILNIGVGFTWSEGVLTTLNKTLSYMVNKSATMYWYTGFDQQPGAMELFESLCNDFDIKCVNISELKDVYSKHLHGGK